jgi:hypothetical protein
MVRGLGVYGSRDGLREIAGLQRFRLITYRVKRLKNFTTEL